MNKQEDNMKIICAWCNKTIKEGDDIEVSHGICESCYAKERAKLKQITLQIQACAHGKPEDKAVVPHRESLLGVSA